MQLAIRCASQDGKYVRQPDTVKKVKAQCLRDGLSSNCFQVLCCPIFFVRLDRPFLNNRKAHFAKIIVRSAVNVLSMRLFKFRSLKRIKATLGAKKNYCFVTGNIHSRPRGTTTSQSHSMTDWWVFFF